MKTNIMKYLTCLFLCGVILFVSSCIKELAADKKMAQPAIKNNVALTGKWKFVESLLDPGDGSGKWLPVQVSAEFELKDDGTTTGNAFPNYITYTLKDSVTLTFKQADTTTQNYFYKISNDTLTMSPAGPIRCIEACGSRFKKVNN